MEAPSLIDWTSDESRVMLNPRMPRGERDRLAALATALPGHLWIATSGTTGVMKLAALSKRAMLVSAAAVNRHLGSGAGDRWSCVLPGFHVGGLGIFARAFLSGARVTAFEWDAARFAAAEGVTLSALVPAQVADLVRAGLRAPSSMRAIVVGGGALPEALRLDALAMGWPLLPSYGLTECCSQVATAAHPAGELVLLDHVEARAEPDGRLALRSDALLTGYATEDGFVDPKRDGWFTTEDLVELEGRTVRVRGRLGDFVKIGGEAVNLARLDRILAEIAEGAAVVAVPDERLGHVIALAVAHGDGVEIARAFDARVMPFERVRRIGRVEMIPRTPLGKLMRERLLEMLG